MIIAIDGPVASGKSTVGKALARKLGFKFFDTGNLYRAVAYLALKNKTASDEKGLVSICEKLQREKCLKDDGTILIALGLEEVSPKLRGEEVGAMASQIAKIAPLRRALIDCQRAWAAEGDLVMVGRDIGTVIVPHATAKFFLEASIEERARRRYVELIDRDEKAVLEEVVSDMKQRDYSDKTRDVAPLTIAHDAIVIDTTDLTMDQVVDLLHQKVLEALS